MDKQKYIVDAFNTLRFKGIVHTQKDFANLLGINAASMSKAFNGYESYLTDKLIDKVAALLENGTSAVSPEAIAMFPALDTKEDDMLLVIPTGARAGTLGDFSTSVNAYDCERMVSPIKGADFAIQVTGDSMAPEYPNGSQIIIKKIDETAFVEWGKVYVLDTANGAVIKQIRKTDTEGVVECVSLNAEYQPFTIPTKQIKGWYRVLMCLALK